ncbi:MAG: GGDEF domain-containing protein [Chloroflexota bacterium]|nr:GGDEF domain-containing protein [Chloroflexota bacterium]
MDRSLAATIARTGGRLAAALLPLAALGVMTLLGATREGSLPVWATPGVEAIGALAAGVALLLTVTAFLERGRMRDLGDATALGLLAATLAGLLVTAVRPLGLGIGLSAAALALGVGTVLGGRRARGRRRRWIGIVVVIIAVDVGLAAALFWGALAGGESVAPFLLGSGAVLATVAAALTWQSGARATVLGVAASSFAALALAGPSDAGRLPGLGGVAVVATGMGWIMAARRLRRNLAPPSMLQPTTATLPGVRSRLQMPIASVAEPEFDESARLSRELRATLDDLVAARRTIGLQRAEIERGSTLDPLTGLPSRGPTLDRLRTEAAEGRRYSHPVTVVLLDIDGFAELNHDYGLSVGDAILREVALRLRLRIREADALGRVGGDSFLAILPHTDEGGAATFAQAVLDRVVARPFTTDRGEITVNLSLGIALMRPGMTLSGEELLAAAEEALASAKAAGGNRIAFDRLHGLARLDERRTPHAPAPEEAGDGAKASEADATR